MSLQTNCRLLIHPTSRYTEILFIVSQKNVDTNENIHLMMLTSYCELYQIRGVSTNKCDDQSCRISLKDNDYDQYDNLLFDLVLYIYDDSEIPALMFMGPAVIRKNDLNETVNIYDLKKFLRDIGDYKFLIINEYYKETGKEKIEEYINKMNNCEILLQSK